MAFPVDSKLPPAELEEIQIIEFTEVDAPEISALFALVWSKASHIPLEWRQKRVINAEQIIDEMHSGYRFFGARINGKIVGLYKTYLTPDGLLGEHQTVHPSYRHRGLVRAMYRQFISLAQQIGASANLCNILYSQHTMRKIVEQFGFKPDGKPYEQAPGMLVQLYKRSVDEA
jgi:hypothetical protein